MLILSGVPRLYEVMPRVIQRVSDVLQTAQGMELLKGAILGLEIDNVVVPIILVILIGIVCIEASLNFFKRE